MNKITKEQIKIIEQHIVNMINYKVSNNRSQADKRIRNEISLCSKWLGHVNAYNLSLVDIKEKKDLTIGDYYK